MSAEPSAENSKWLEVEKHLLEAVRDRVRDARKNELTGELVFRFQFNRGGPDINKWKIGMQVSYEFPYAAQLR